MHNARDKLVGSRVLCLYVRKGEKCLMMLCDRSINNGMPSDQGRLGKSGSDWERLLVSKVVATGLSGDQWCGHPRRQSTMGSKRNVLNEKTDFVRLKDLYY
jgi:hypothetical protein